MNRRSDSFGTLPGPDLAALDLSERTALEGYAVRAAEPLTGLPPHLQDLGLHAEGGMGVVRLARDNRLDRILALKVSRRPHVDPAAALDEARLTARLEHPSIVPVHDCGLLPGGRVWFTMRLVRGEDLGRHIEAVHHATLDGSWVSTTDGWTLRRLVAVFEQACQAVAYAHEQGVMHRDLKPQNILIGRFGEVQVVDWGLASDRVGVGDAARIMGTPGYMPPEQAAGPEAGHGPHSDVFSLGATLFTLLAGRPPWGARVDDVLRRPRAPFQALPVVPEALADWVDRCLAREPQQRGTAAALGAGMRAWLDGARRREEAAALVASVAALPARAEAARGEAAALREEAAGLLADVKPWAPAAEKVPAWDREDRADALESEADLDELRYVEGLQAALKVDPGYAEADARLADHHQYALAVAEARHDARAAARAAYLLKAHDRAGRHAAWLSAGGRVELRVSPPAAVIVERYTRVARRLVPTPVATWAPATDHQATLPAGSYRLRVAADGRPEVIVPLVLGRGRDWDGVPPEGGEPAVLVLPETLPADHCAVPAGWFTAHGDPDALDPLPPRRFWVDGFVVERFPVSIEAWIGFLEALAAAGEATESFVPVDGSGADARPLLRHTPGGWEPGTYQSGLAVGLRDPVGGIDLAAARRHAAWRASVDGLPWRLGHELEWEKAARGVDGRLFPWGDHHDPSWSCTQSSHPGLNRVAAVDDFPDDVSPYGVRGLAGNVRTWCATTYRRGGEPGPRLDWTEAGEFQNVRGGAWFRGAAFARSATRVVHRPAERPPLTGLRLFRAWPR